MIVIIKAQALDAYRSVEYFLCLLFSVQQYMITSYRFACQQLYLHALEQCQSGVSIAYAVCAPIRACSGNFSIESLQTACRPVSSHRLVPGDVVVLLRGKATCDMVLLQGSCLVEESMLSGEVRPWTQTAGIAVALIVASRTVRCSSNLSLHYA